MTAAPPVAPAAPPPAARPASAPPAIPKAPPPPAANGIGLSAPASRKFAVERGVAKASGQLVCIYGPGGIGKTSLAALAPAPLFLDLESGTRLLNVARVSDIQTWADLLAVLRDDSLFAGIKTVVVDSVTRAEQFAVAHTLATVPHEKGTRVTSVEGYGFGKGYSHVFDTFLTLFPVLQAHTRAGRNVVLISHDCTATVPNPQGEDWIRYEPMLQAPASGKNSIRLALRNEVDHLLFVGYDVNVTADGKGQGQGTRRIYPTELPHFMAKSRSLRDQIPFTEGDPSLWNLLLAAKEAE